MDFDEYLEYDMTEASSASGSVSPKPSVLEPLTHPTDPHALSGDPFFGYNGHNSGWAPNVYDNNTNAMKYYNPGEAPLFPFAMDLSFLQSAAAQGLLNLSAPPAAGLFPPLNPAGTKLAPIEEATCTVAPSSLVKEPKVKQEPTELSIKSESSKERESSVPPEETMTLEVYAAQQGLDIKKLSPKERRQLRNKISARNFRVRRKGKFAAYANASSTCITNTMKSEYISTLEAQVDEYKKKAEQLQSRLDTMEEENMQLRQEMVDLRKQLERRSRSPSPSSSEGSHSPTSPRISSPLPQVNVNKDISMLGSKATETYRQDTRILVSNAVMPAWNYNEIFALDHDKTASSKLDYQQALHFAESILVCFVTFTQALSMNGKLPAVGVNHACDSDDEISGGDSWVAPLLPDERDFSSFDDLQKHQPVAKDVVSPAYMEYLYDTLIMSALTGSETADKSFRWWDI